MGLRRRIGNRAPRVGLASAPEEATRASVPIVQDRGCGSLRQQESFAPRFDLVEGDRPAGRRGVAGRVVNTADIAWVRLSRRSVQRCTEQGRRRLARRSLIVSNVKTGCRREGFPCLRTAALKPPDSDTAAESDRSPPASRCRVRTAPRRCLPPVAPSMSPR